MYKYKQKAKRCLFVVGNATRSLCMLAAAGGLFTIFYVINKPQVLEVSAYTNIPSSDTYSVYRGSYLPDTVVKDIHWTGWENPAGIRTRGNSYPDRDNPDGLGGYYIYSKAGGWGNQGVWDDLRSEDATDAEKTKLREREAARDRAFSQQPSMVISRSANRTQFFFPSWHLMLLAPSGTSTTTLFANGLCYDWWDTVRGATTWRPELMEIKLLHKNSTGFDDARNQAIYTNVSETTSPYTRPVPVTDWDNKTTLCEGQNLSVTLGDAYKRGSKRLVSKNGQVVEYDVYHLALHHTDTRPSDEYMSMFNIGTHNSGNLLVMNPDSEMYGFNLRPPAAKYHWRYNAEWRRKYRINLPWMITFEGVMKSPDFCAATGSSSLGIKVRDNDLSSVNATVYRKSLRDYRTDAINSDTSARERGWQQAGGYTTFHKNTTANTVTKNRTFDPNYVYRIKFRGMSPHDIVGLNVPLEPVPGCGHDIELDLNEQCDLYVTSVRNISKIANRTPTRVKVSLAHKSGSNYTVFNSLTYTDPVSNATTTLNIGNKEIAANLSTIDKAQYATRTPPDDRLLASFQFSNIYGQTNYRDYSKLGLLITGYSWDDSGTTRNVTLTGANRIFVDKALPDSQRDLTLGAWPRTDSDCGVKPKARVVIDPPCPTAADGLGSIRLEFLEWKKRSDKDLHVVGYDKSNNEQTSFTQRFSQGSDSQDIKTGLTKADYDAKQPYKFWIMGYYDGDPPYKPFLGPLTGTNRRLPLKYKAQVVVLPLRGTCDDVPPGECTELNDYNITSTRTNWPAQTLTRNNYYTYQNGSQTRYDKCSYQETYWTQCWNAVRREFYRCQQTRTVYCEGHNAPVSGKRLSTAYARVKYTFGKLKMTDAILRNYIQAVAIQAGGHARDNASALQDTSLPIKLRVKVDRSQLGLIDPDRTKHVQITGDTRSRISARNTPQDSSFNLVLNYSIYRRDVHGNNQGPRLLYGTLRDDLGNSSSTDTIYLTANRTHTVGSPHAAGLHGYNWEINWYLNVEQYINYDWTKDEIAWDPWAGSPGYDYRENFNQPAYRKRSRSIQFRGTWKKSTCTLVVIPPTCIVNLSAATSSFRENRHFDPETENGYSRETTPVFAVGQPTSRTKLTLRNYNQFDLQTTAANQPRYRVSQGLVYNSGQDPGITSRSSTNPIQTIASNARAVYVESATTINYPGKYYAIWNVAWETKVKDRYPPNPPASNYWEGLEHKDTKCTPPGSLDKIDRVDNRVYPVYIWADPPTCRVQTTVFEMNSPNKKIQVTLTNPNAAPMTIDRQDYKIYERPSPDMTTIKFSGTASPALTTIPASGSITLKTPSFSINDTGLYRYVWDIKTSMGAEAWTTVNNETGQRSWFEYLRDHPNEEHIDGSGVSTACQEDLRVVVRPYVKVFYAGLLAGARFGSHEAEMAACQDYTADHVIGSDSSVHGYVAAHADQHPDDAPFHRGSSSQYETSAHDVVDGFYSASQRNLPGIDPPVPLKGLTLGNINAAYDFGGDFSRSQRCIANYWRQLETAGEPITTVGAVDLGVTYGSLPLSRVRQRYDVLNLSPLETTTAPVARKTFRNYSSASRSAWETRAINSFADVTSTSFVRGVDYYEVIGFLLDRGVLTNVDNSVDDCDTTTGVVKLCVGAVTATDGEENRVSRGQTAVWIARYLNRGSIPTQTGTSSFTDITATTPADIRNAVLYLENHPDINRRALSYDGGTTYPATASTTFNPDGKATRNWTVTLLNQTLSIPNATIDYFDDDSTYSTHLQQVLNNFADQTITFGVDSCVSRGTDPHPACNFNFAGNPLDRQNNRRMHMLSFIARAMIWRDTNVAASSPRTLVISNSAPNQDLLYSKATIYVDGDVHIVDNIINNENYVFRHPSQLGYITIVARGHIYIDPSVTRLDALLVAYPREETIVDTERASEGIIYTCNRPAGIAAAAHFATCGNQLVVNGGLIGQSIRLGRVHGTVRNALAAVEGPTNRPLTTPRTVIETRVPTNVLRDYSATQITALETLAERTYPQDSNLINPPPPHRTYWASKYVGFLLEKNILSGGAEDDCDTGRPGTQIMCANWYHPAGKRGRVAVWVARALNRGQPIPDQTGRTSSFTDINNAPTPADIRNAVLYLEHEAGIDARSLRYRGGTTFPVSGDPGFNNFDFDGDIHKVWVVYLLSKAFPVPDTDRPHSYYFTDLGGYPEEVQKAIANAAQALITDGGTSCDTNTWNCSLLNPPPDTFKRNRRQSQAIAMIARAIVWYDLHRAAGSIAGNNAAEVVNLLPEYLLAHPELPFFPDWIYSAPAATSTINLNF